MITDIAIIKTLIITELNALCWVAVLTPTVVMLVRSSSTAATAGRAAIGASASAFLIERFKEKHLFGGKHNEKRQDL